MTQYHDIYINGVKLPSPSTYKASYEDLEAEGIRIISTGVLKRNRIRPRVFQCDLSWSLKNLVDTKVIFDMLEPETFIAKVFDYKANDYVEKKMYCSSCEYEYVRTLQGIKASGISANLVEV